MIKTTNRMVGTISVDHTGAHLLTVRNAFGAVFRAKYANAKAAATAVGTVDWWNNSPGYAPFSDDVKATLNGRVVKVIAILPTDPYINAEENIELVPALVVQGDNKLRVIATEFAALDAAAYLKQILEPQNTK